MAFLFVTREGCGKAEEILKALGLPYARKEVDKDPELFRLYPFRVPVLLLGERVLLEGVFEKQAVEEILHRLEEEGVWTR